MKSLVNIFKELFLHHRWLYISISIVVIFCLGFAWPVFAAIGKLLLLVLVVMTVIDASLLFSKKEPFVASRQLDDKLSNGDHNPVTISIEGKYGFMTHLSIIDEFPVQLQLRDKRFLLPDCKPYFREVVQYTIRPVERGVYEYGDLRIFVSTRFKLVKRMVTIDATREVKVYPSFIQYRKYSFMAISNRLEEIGVKKVRQVGISNEFEQIREYVEGDDFRSINWRATARRNELMVNQYQEERAQNVYCLIDKGRLMHMPFDGLSLIDYSINASLVLGGIAIARGDKSGLITFSDKIGTLLPASSKATQMNAISEALYNQDARMRETDYLRLYKNIKIRIKKRSLLILFTNFDSLVSLGRQMKYLKAINKDHLLCTVIFENTGINHLADQPVKDLTGVYKQTIAEKFRHDKRLIKRELNKNGIFCILTEPKNLTINTINRYIEFKARGAI